MSFLQCIIFEADRFGVLAHTLRGITVVPQRCCRYDLPGCTLGRVFAAGMSMRRNTLPR